MTTLAAIPNQVSQPLPPIAPTTPAPSAPWLQSCFDAYAAHRALERQRELAYQHEQAIRENLHHDLTDTAARAFLRALDAAPRNYDLQLHHKPDGDVAAIIHAGKLIFSIEYALNTMQFNPPVTPKTLTKWAAALPKLTSGKLEVQWNLDADPALKEALANITDNRENGLQEYDYSRTVSFKSVDELKVNIGAAMSDFTYYRACALAAQPDDEPLPTASDADGTPPPPTPPVAVANPDSNHPLLDAVLRWLKPHITRIVRDELKHITWG
jgi:hypothetical protein